MEVAGGGGSSWIRATRRTTGRRRAREVQNLAPATMAAGASPVRFLAEKKTNEEGREIRGGRRKAGSERVSRGLISDEATRRRHGCGPVACSGEELQAR